VVGFPASPLSPRSRAHLPSSSLHIPASPRASKNSRAPGSLFPREGARRREGIRDGILVQWGLIGGTVEVIPSPCSVSWCGPSLFQGV
jgi:hypothetical protein